MNLTRRAFVASGATALGLSAASAQAGTLEFASLLLDREPFPVQDPSTIEIGEQFRRQLVQYSTDERVGTVIVDPSNHFLYLVMEAGMALRYGVGVGREGFEWKGASRVARKAKWPTWTPPLSMIKRQPELAIYATGMAGGPDNPMGARALYLYDGPVDTLYRIHGTHEPWSIGTSMSSGCIRMLNYEVIDLYRRVPIGARVVVL